MATWVPTQQNILVSQCNPSLQELNLEDIFRSTLWLQGINTSCYLCSQASSGDMQVSTAPTASYLTIMACDRN